MPEGTVVAATVFEPSSVRQRVLVRTNDAPGTLDTSPIDGLAGWLAFDAWPADVGFRRGTDVLREVLHDAWTRA